MASLVRQQALLRVDGERNRQEALKASGRFAHTCADPEMDELERLAVLLEEVGEVARALNESHGIVQLERELCQVAAVAVAWLEGLSSAEQNRDEAMFVDKVRHDAGFGK